MALLVVAAINCRQLTALGQTAERIMSRNYVSIRAAQQARQILEENGNLALAFIFQAEPGVILAKWMRNSLKSEYVAEMRGIKQLNISFCIHIKVTQSAFQVSTENVDISIRKSKTSATVGGGAKMQKMAEVSVTSSLNASGQSLQARMEVMIIDPFS